MSVSSGIGLISGINTESIISQMASASRLPETLLKQRESVLSAKSQAYGTLSEKLTALRDQLANMLDASDFSFTSANSSDASILGVTADKTASAASYSIKVLQLAQSARMASQGVTDLDDPIASGNGLVTIQTGSGTVRNYTVSSSTTMANLRDMINADTSSGVRASIINDGSAINPYRLVLTGKDTGASNAVTFLNNDTTLNFMTKSIEAAVAGNSNQFNGSVTSSGTYTGSGTANVVMKVTQAGTVDGTGAAKFVVSLDGGLTFGTTEYSASSTAQDVSGGMGIQVAFGAGTTNFAKNDTFSIDAFDPTLSQASDAIISVDGIRISRSTNTFSEVASGVTFTAKTVSANAVTVSVQNEAGLLNAEVVKFATAYNDLVNTAKSLSAYDSTTKKSQPLFGDSALRGIQNSLSSILTNPIKGIGSLHNTLASIGLNLQSDGTVKVDTTKLNDVLNNDLGSIAKIFGKIGESTNTEVQVANLGKKISAGTYSVNITAAASRAQIDGAQALAASGLAANETLTFTVGSKTFTATLLAGDKIDSVISKLNATFAAEGVGIQATDNGGSLQLLTTAYGSDQSFSVVSDQSASGNSQLGIGTSLLSSTGTDVAGTINGQVAKGTGQTLKGIVGGTLEGLELTITATAPTTSILTVTSGIADEMSSKINPYLDGDTAVIKTKQDGITSSIQTMDDQIEKIESRITAESDRMRAQFLAMEKALAKMQGMGDYVAKAISQLQTSSSK